MNTKSTIIFAAMQQAIAAAENMPSIDYFSNPSPVSKTRSKGIKAENDNKRLKRKQARVARRHNR